MTLRFLTACCNCSNPPRWAAGTCPIAFAEDRQRCFAAGMSEVLVKPFEPDTLHAMLLQWLSRG